MCGRFTLRASPEVLRATFAIETTEPYAARYNIAPSQPVLAVIAADERRVAHFVRWGLVPSWARDPRIGARLINARAETVAEKPAFRAAFRRRRCLVPADGYYEWQPTAHGKQAWFVHRADDGCFAFAGLWEHWERDGSVIESCTILTCAANARLATIHDRMPVIIAPVDHARWLAPERAGPPPVDLLRPPAADVFELHAVSSHVNSPRHDDPACVAPLAARV